MEEIAASGAVVSENPFGTQPEAGYFPARNRIISGLSRGTVIVEAAARQRFADHRPIRARAGQEIVRSPGKHRFSEQPRNPQPDQTGRSPGGGKRRYSEGNGHGPRKATVSRRKYRAPFPQLTTQEQRCSAAFSTNRSISTLLMKESGLTAGKLNAVLISLELKGLINQVPGKYFVRSCDEAPDGRHSGRYDDEPVLADRGPGQKQAGTVRPRRPDHGDAPERRVSFCTRPMRRSR